jgi:hypothetical protein
MKWKSLFVDLLSGLRASASPRQNDAREDRLLTRSHSAAWRRNSSSAIGGCPTVVELDVCRVAATQICQGGVGCSKASARCHTTLRTDAPLAEYNTWELQTSRGLALSSTEELRGEANAALPRAPRTPGPWRLGQFKVLTEVDHGFFLSSRAADRAISRDRGECRKHSLSDPPPRE